MARRRKGGHHRRRSIRRSRRGVGGVAGKVKHFFMGIIRKPVSRILAPALGIAAVLQLFTPLSNGDGFWNRLNTILKSLQPGQTPNILAQDAGGPNNILTIVGPQILANAFPAALTGIGAAITYKIGKFLGM